jgi:chromosomal replication initiator protein
VPEEPDALSDDLESIWRRTREDLRMSLPASTYRLWLEQLRVVGLRGQTLYLTAPPAAKIWIERRYVARVESALRRQAPQIEAVEVVVPETRTADDAGEPSGVPTSLPVDPAHTFDRFVIGPANRLAHASALAVAELPGDAYNPLFLHGPPGLGKTHLLGAIANYMRRRHPDRSVHLTTAERFTSEFVSALRANGPERFKRLYRGLDALLIDDVHVLEGKERTEEEFVHTFNALHGAGKQIVLSSDRPPDALAQLAERLRDRFSWGLTVEIGPPDLRTRTALLLRMASDAPGGLPDAAALRDIASRVTGNVRRLEGAMTRVVAFGSLLGEPLSRAVIDQALHPSRSGAAGAPRREAAITVETIQESVCATLGLRREELLSPARTERVVRGRQLGMYLTRELTSLSLAGIARAFNRDHSTVIHAIRSVEGRLEPGSDTALVVHRIRHDLEGHSSEDSPVHPPDRDP